MVGCKVPFFDDDDIRLSSIHEDISSNESDSEILLNTYYYEPLAMEDNFETSEPENLYIALDAEHDNFSISTCSSYDSSEAENDGEKEIKKLSSDNCGISNYNYSNLSSTLDVEIERELWNQPRPQELQIELDSNKTQEILNVMANVNLPNVTIPEWAYRIPEENWKQLLLQRISSKQLEKRCESTRKNNEQGN